MSDGFLVDAAELKKAAEKIEAISQDAERSRLDSVVDQPQQYGHDGLAKAVSDFCDGARVAIPAMTGTSRSIGTALAKSADDYRSVDAHVAGIMDTGKNDGAPYSEHQQQGRKND